MGARFGLGVAATGVLLLALWTGSASSQSGDVARGEATYKELCAKCHGPSGKGNGKEAATLETKPKDLTDCARMVKFADLDLFRVVKNGGPALDLSKDMPSYSEAMDDDEIYDVIAFVRSFCKP